MVKTEPRRGAVEHYYRAVERAFIPSQVAKCMPEIGQQVVGSDILEEIDRDVGDALEAGRFYRPRRLAGGFAIRRP